MLWSGILVTFLPPTVVGSPAPSLEEEGLGTLEAFCEIVLECKRPNQIALCTCCHRNIRTIR